MSEGAWNRPHTGDAESLHLVHVEDSTLDAELLKSVLESAGFDCDIQVVDTEAALCAALASPSLDLVVSDYSIPAFSGLGALRVSRARRPDLPFIFVSGTIGEERAIEALKEGATDYVLKDRPARLVPAIRRALAEKASEEARRSALRDQREAEERLRSSEAQFRAVAETIPCALFISEGPRRVYVNRGAEELTGYTRDELLAGEIGDIVHPDEQEEVRRRGLGPRRGVPPSSPFELRLRTRSGEERWALFSTSTIEYAGFPATLATALDVTERRRAEEALRRQAASLAQAEKLAAMGSLLAGVAHELNNPLAVIVGQSELLARGLAGTAAERVERISAAAARCARIVKNFLALARQRPPERQWVHLGRVVAEALELVAYPARSAGIEVLTDLPDDLPLVWADPHQVHQVVVNLVTNAHHALRDQPSARRIAVSLGRHDGDGVFLEVADTGPGIPAALVARVFEPFFTTKPAGEGTGLGLSLCRGIVENHGGVMRLHSQEGLGTLFRVELPAHTGAADLRPAPAAAAAPVPGARVLVVDDEKDLALMVAELLTAEGHQVDVVTFAQQALERLGTNAYDVVLCDIRMPGMDGPALYASVQKQFPGLERRFAFLTGDTFSGGSAAFLEKSGARSLAKPFTLDEVVGMVNEVREGAAVRPPPTSPKAAGAAGA